MKKKLFKERYYGKEEIAEEKEIVENKKQVKKPTKRGKKKND